MCPLLSWQRSRKVQSKSTSQSEDQDHEFMDSRNTHRTDELAAETPEDVAVLYSWANLHGAKYRDFSASRREYRAQLRHRAAEQIREQELQAQAEAEAAASAADAAARQAQLTAMALHDKSTGDSREQALRDAG